MRKTALKRCKLKRRQINSNYQGCIYSNQCRSAYGNVKALRPFEYPLPHINLTLTVLLERLISTLIFCLSILVDLWGCEQESPSMERHAVCSSFSLCAEQLELPLQTSPLNPSSPSSTPLSLCVCVCVCVCGGRPGNEKSWTVAAWENDFRAGWYQHKSSHMHTAESF